MKKIKKFSMDKKYLKISLCALVVIASAILIVKAADNFSSISSFFRNAVSGAASVLSPFINGFFIAFFLNAPMRWFELSVFGRIKRLKNKPRLLRILSISAAYLVLVCLTVWLLRFALPEIIESAKGLAQRLTNSSGYIDISGLREIYENPVLISAVDSINEAFSTELTVSGIIASMLGPILGVLSSLPTMLSGFLSGALSTVGAVINFAIGMIIAFYMLCEKDNIKGFMLKLLKVTISGGASEKALAFAGDLNNTVERFIVGKTIDSAIIGGLFLIIALVLKLPYPFLLCVIVGASNMIPYFGPVVGGTIMTVIVTFEDPFQGLQAGIAIVLLQQFDGNILGPKILGESTGLKAMGVIFATLAGGALFGVPGMFFGTPVFSVFVNMFKRFINNKYEEKRVKNTAREKGSET